MSSNKTSKKKKVLGKALKQNRRVPIFVIAKTRRAVTRNSKRRNWRSQKLDVDSLLKKVGNSKGSKRLEGSKK